MAGNCKAWKLLRTLMKNLIVKPDFVISGDENDQIL